MSDNRFLSEQHCVSYRWAVFEDDGLSAWLYLTEPNSEKPTAVCSIYNRIANSEPAENYLSQGIAPPAPSNIIRDDALTFLPETFSFRFGWSDDGESIALFGGDVLLGFVISGEKRGFSRNITKAGIWGILLDENLYKKTFIV